MNNKIKTEVVKLQTDLDLDLSNPDLREEEETYVQAFNDALLIWLRAGDSNSAYFHKVVKGRISRSRIDVVSCVDAMDMVKIVTPQEVKEAIFSMENDKSPGPDGYTAAFFKEAWTIISNDVTKAVQEFFINALISLPLFPEEESLITFLTQDIMHNYHLDRGPPRCSFKVDIQKAYDMIYWGFLREILIGFGFHPRKRGLRQGDPLSLYLFTLIMKVFTLMLHRRIYDSKLFTYYRDCKELIENVHDRIRDWKNKSMSAASRLQLLRSVIGSMHIYWASAFILATRTVQLFLLGLIVGALPALSQDMRDSLEWRVLGNIKPFSVATVWDSIHPRGDAILWYNVVWNYMKVYAGLPKVSASLNSVVDYIIAMSKRRFVRESKEVSLSDYKVYQVYGSSQAVDVFFQEDEERDGFCASLEVT
ncbi:reverse transcriptase domain-containing protein [Tanacetum coccineum]